MFNRVFRSVALLSLFASFSMFAMGCDDDNGSNDSNNDNKGGSEKQKEYVPGVLNTPSAATPQVAKNAPDCTVLKKSTDFTLTDYATIVNYLVDHCKLSEYFQFESFKDNKGVIGDPCFCYGEACSMAGYERPEQEKIFGCDAVGTPAPGAVRGCFRSSDARESGISPAIYFPNGMCTVMMGNCYQTDADCAKGECHKIDASHEKFDKSANGLGYICNMAKFGDWSHQAEFTSCPAGSKAVLTNFFMPISVTIGTNVRSAMLEARVCLPSCEKDSDCHGSSEYDAITNEQGQVKCLDISDKCKSEDYQTVPAKVCFDQRIIDQSSIGICATNVEGA